MQKESDSPFTHLITGLISPFGSQSMRLNYVSTTNEFPFIYLFIILRLGMDRS